MLKVYIVHAHAEILRERSMKDLTNEEVKKLVETDPYNVQMYNSLESFQFDWNNDNLYYPSESYIRIIDEPEVDEAKTSTFTVSVEWDTDGEDVKDLPTIVAVPIEVEDLYVADWLSDHYGWCVYSWRTLQR